MKAQYGWVIALAAVVVLQSCGGGGGAQSGGTGGTGVVVVSSGVMTKGSIILNGVRYEDTAANIVIDDKPKTAANLQSGMVVKVKGSANGVSGVAERIEAQIEVRGTVSSKDAAANPPSFVVLGQTVIVDDRTIFSNLGNFAAIIANTTVVEVHGLRRDETGRLRATRIEGGLTDPGSGIFMADASVDEIRGVVVAGPGVNPARFTLGGQSVVVNVSTSITPPGASYSNGSVVEVHCARPCIQGSDFVAARLDVESAEDSMFQPATGGRFEVEGLVSGFNGHPGSFFVAGVPVTTSGSTAFEGGIATDIGNDIEVEAEGVWNGNALVASKIELERSVVRLQGVVTASSAPMFTLNISGAGTVSVEADDFTSNSGGFPQVDPNTCIQVRGQRKAVGAVVITAGEITTNCSSSGDHLIQAAVEVESGATLTLLGLPINVGNPSDNPPFQNTDDSGITSSAFFNAVVAANPGPPAVAGTLVKVRFNTPGGTVKQVELED